MPATSPLAYHPRSLLASVQVLLGNTDSCAAFPAAPALHRIIFACEMFTNVVMLWGASHAIASMCHACALPRAADEPRAASPPKRQRTSNERISTINEPRGAAEVQFGSATVAAAI